MSEVMSLSLGPKMVDDLDQGFTYDKNSQSYTAIFSANTVAFDGSKANRGFPEISEYIKSLPDSLNLLAQGMSIPTICVISSFIYVSKDP
jgi:hypothetical protein